MKRRRVFAAVLAVIFIVLCLSGCRSEIREYPQEFSGSFVIVDESLLNFSSYCKVVKDTQTGVLYLFVKSGYGGGLSVMYNADGTVMTAD